MPGQPHRLIRAMAALVFTLCVIALPSSNHVAFAQSTQPTAFGGLYEHEPIRSSVATTQGASADGSTPTSTLPRKSSNIADPTRVILALGIVLGIIFALRWIGRRYFPAVAGGRSGGAVRVLSRTPVAPKQQVLLLHVGRRVLVVADNGAQLNPLSEISEADEVAQIIGQISNASQTGVFESAFGKAQDTFTEVSSQASDETAGQLMDEQAEMPTEAANQEESISSAQGDIKGLMDKVRGLAEQLGRST